MTHEESVKLFAAVCQSRGLDPRSAIPFEAKPTETRRVLRVAWDGLAVHLGWARITLTDLRYSLAETIDMNGTRYSHGWGYYWIS